LVQEASCLEGAAAGLPGKETTKFTVLSLRAEKLPYPMLLTALTLASILSPRTKLKEEPVNVVKAILQ
jgi:hypothetical protein